MRSGDGAPEHFMASIQIVKVLHSDVASRCNTGEGPEAHYEQRYEESNPIDKSFGDSPATLALPLGLCYCAAVLLLGRVRGPC